ncbi:hypothetical protein JR316_0010290 [Psilocybe cubensis]|uniref:Hydrophobic surface binding protein n=2 Tax=Psilocybe cubensis TaxID=181762 RepID=A0A8H8CGN5_PSICU|nr:hypothetical protein JR316_0010290 [Psilocybe cubensis]KAH9478053.1 hypothetical protein JR316_0010290 [Psilocybe cubensis]
MKFQSSFFILTSLLSVGFATTTADVKADIATITSQAKALQAAIMAFPNNGGSLITALAMHTDAVNLGSAIDKATSDVNAVTPKPFAEADGSAILAAVQKLEPIITNTVNQIVSKKAAFQALPLPNGSIPALVKQDLVDLNSKASRFEAALTKSASPNHVAAATAIKASLDAAVARAIAAYS